MWIDPLLVQRLDNPAGRPELARRATMLAREALPEVDIEILWDDMWIRRVGAHYFPDPEMVNNPEPKWQRWATQAEKHLRDADDYWFHVYKPRSGDVIVDIGGGRGEDVFAFSRAIGPRTAASSRSNRTRCRFVYCEKFLRVERTLQCHGAELRLCRSAGASADRDHAGMGVELCTSRRRYTHQPCRRRGDVRQLVRAAWNRPHRFSQDEYRGRRAHGSPRL